MLLRTNYVWVAWRILFQLIALCVFVDILVCPLLSFKKPYRSQYCVARKGIHETVQSNFIYIIYFFCFAGKIINVLMDQRFVLKLHTKLEKNTTETYIYTFITCAICGSKITQKTLKISQALPHRKQIKLLKKLCILYQDNAPTNNNNKDKVQVLDHITYSLDLAPSNLYLFPTSNLH